MMVGERIWICSFGDVTVDVRKWKYSKQTQLYAPCTAYRLPCYRTLATRWEVLKNLLANIKMCPFARPHCFFCSALFRHPRTTLLARANLVTSHSQVSLVTLISLVSGVRVGSSTCEYDSLPTCCVCSTVQYVGNIGRSQRLLLNEFVQWTT
jgi:hypothetical protein